MALSVARPSGSAHPLVLLVGFSESVHVARWARMLFGHGFRLVLVPALGGSITPEFGPTVLVSTAADVAALTDREVAVFDVASVSPRELEATQRSHPYQPWTPAWLSQARFNQPAHVAAAIRALQPQLVHAMVVQFGGYLCAATRELFGDAFPPWLLSNWGSDIFLHRMQPEHRDRIMRLMPLLDGYHAECQRDVGIARQFGFRKLVCPAIPASGGIDFAACPKLADLPPPSARREVVIKGYHGWSGRALHILAALHIAADALRDFRIRITLAPPPVIEMAAAIAASDGLDIVCERYLPDHADALARLAQARVVLGLGISDGISTTLLEAMSVGTFPIQGDRSCGAEWVVAGETGFLVSPHDPAALADMLVRALTDDALVDRAATHNRAVVERRWNAAINGPIAAEVYRSLIEQTRKPPTKSPRSSRLQHA